MNSYLSTLFIKSNNAKGVRCLTTGLVLLSALFLTSKAVGAPVMVEVSGFEIVGNSLIPAAEIQELLRPFIGQQSLEGITAASQALQSLYIQAGYAGVVTSVPAQTL